MPPTKTGAAVTVAFFYMDNGTKCVDTSKTLENRIKIINNLKNTLIQKLTSLLYKRFLLRGFNLAKLHECVCASIRYASQK